MKDEEVWLFDRASSVTGECTWSRTYPRRSSRRFPSLSLLASFPSSHRASCRCCRATSRFWLVQRAASKDAQVEGGRSSARSLSLLACNRTL